jgi:hypothetical protein
MRYPLPPLFVTMSGLVFLLGGILAYQVLAPITQYEVPQAAPRELVLPSPAAPPFLPPAFAQFSEIDEHPLFVPDRRAFNSAEAVKGIQQRVPPELTLIGIILDASRKIAIVKPRAAATKYLTLGQTLEGWRVAAIEVDHVELQSGDETFKVTLPRPAPVPAASRPATPSQPSRPALPPGVPGLPSTAR